MSEQGKGWTLRSCCLPLQSPSQTAPVEQTICLNPVHNENICSQNRDFYTHKPVAWMISDNCGTHFIEDKRDWYDAAGVESITPLYTHPKEWVGLTDEEIRHVIKHCEKVATDHAGWVGEQRLIWCRAIEAKLKEKNT